MSVIFYVKSNRQASNVQFFAYVDSYIAITNHFFEINGYRFVNKENFKICFF
ncbi:hypothetical protein DYBT9275_00459 [Dyadobacter sp. CECT 9275]|uniref:Uncharacterized protein n=1 Tax=Dyadobacter helix TaxID=2822344 RepID=A0A916J815_9BACT|nr:hypothetical protein DYBT9275_00459 [Dyadobacter sp. CECT 9275]